ncbi:MAG: transposase [Melioribacter sp.]|nr:transposase [Melioribacter sp.]
MATKFYRANTYHHVYNRGALKSKIFFDKEDYNYFLHRLKRHADRNKIEILAYCLMPNHFHLFAKQTTDFLTIGKFIGDLQNGFTKFINKKYKRSGVAFEGPAKAKYVTNESYHKPIVEYILLNPVSAHLVKTADSWMYSTANEIVYDANRKITSIDELIKIYTSRENLLSAIKELTDTKLPVEEILNLEGHKLENNDS